MPKPKKGGEFLALLSLADHHFGKLCWSPEAGTNYDLKIAEVLFRDAVDDLIAECAGKSVERWLFPLGNDLVHIDNSRNKTFNETPQDVDGRYAKIIETAEMSVIRAVERMAETAPVSVLWIPGNHDRTTSFHVARTVQAWFRNCPRVTVDVGPNPRKYFQWHRTLLGFTHGDQEKIATLPNIMASERPKEWAASDCRHWFLGHMHRSRKWLTQGGDAFEGTEIKVMRSLGGTDRWHHDNGYIGGEKSRAAEVHWYGKTRGYSGHAIVNARAA